MNILEQLCKQLMNLIIFILDPPWNGVRAGGYTDLVSFPLSISQIIWGYLKTKYTAYKPNKTSHKLNWCTKKDAYKINVRSCLYLMNNA